MNAELVKRQDRWDLYGEDGSKKASSAPNPMGKLSISNCESIANGYDLKQMAIEKYDPTYVPSMFINFEIDCKREGFIEGCKAILELLSDKKYDYSQLNKMYTCGSLYEASRNKAYSFDNVLSKFEKTTWNVEIEMERSKFIADKSLRNDIKNGFNYTPKLDADGCLILKRKK